MKYCLRNMKLLRNEVSFGYEVKFAHHVRQHTSYAQRTSYAKHTSLARRANFIEKPPSRWLGGFSGDPSEAVGPPTSLRDAFGPTGTLPRAKKVSPGHFFAPAAPGPPFRVPGSPLKNRQPRMGLTIFW